jgi:hypothetical protein
MKSLIASDGTDIATVKMIQATLNNHLINPPYGPHTRVANYEFHSSLPNYTGLARVNRGTHRIVQGQFMWMYWTIRAKGPNGTFFAWRYVGCNIPGPSSGTPGPYPVPNP